MIPNDRAFNGKNYFQDGDKTIYRYQRFDKVGIYRLKIRFVSVNSPYKQGIAIKLSKKPEFKGVFLINGIQLSTPKKKHWNYVIQEGEFLGNEFEIELKINEGFIAFCNASNFLSGNQALTDKIIEMTGKNAEQFENKGFTSGFSATNIYGNAFWVEQISNNQYRFHCNDHAMDDDYDDLIFDLFVEYSALK